MAATTNYQQNGTDLSNVYVTKEYIQDWYPDLVTQLKTPQLWMWGSNNYGMLGDNTTVNKSSPVTTVAGRTNWKQVSNKSTFTAAVKTDNSLWLWGLNNKGQLGDSTTVNKSSPINPLNVITTNWKQVSCGYFHWVGIDSTNRILVCGYNNLGQLGDNTTVNKSSPVINVLALSPGNIWKQVSCGGYHNAAVSNDGRLFLWGQNSSGKLGDSTVVNKSSPISTAGGGTTWKQVSCGSDNTAAVKTDGTLWTWGACGYGQLGDNTTINKSSPVTTAGGGTTWKQVSVGWNHMGAIKTDGTLWTWGCNWQLLSSLGGQLGDNTTTNRSSPVQVSGGGTNWKQVAAGNIVTAAIKTDGTLWTWGDNSQYGQLGTNTTTNRSSPGTTVLGGTNWKSIGDIWNGIDAISESEGW